MTPSAEVATKLGTTLQQLGPYKILAPIGAGSSATVFRAHNEFLDREVAIKILKSDALERTSARTNRRLFLHEAKVAAMLRHPHIVTIHDAVADGDIDYIVMENVYNGRSLQRYCKPGDEQFSIDESVELVQKCALALSHAHEQDVVHRDIKPRNILMDRGNEPRITDFGLALTLRPDAAMTYLMGAGSPLYMSPEQIMEEPLSGQTDVYSLGIVLYELLTGVHPFRAKTITDVLRNVLGRSPPALRKLRADAPKPLEQILERAMAKRCGHRYRTARDFAADLDNILDLLQGARAERRQRQKLELARRLSFFKEFSEEELREVTAQALTRHYARDEEIFAEGERSSSFFFLLDGEVTVLRGTTTVTTLGRGACVGEMAALTGRLRAVSVVAKKASTVLMFPQSILSETSVGCRLKLKDQFLKRMVGRLEDMLGFLP